MTTTPQTTEVIQPQDMNIAGLRALLRSERLPREAAERARWGNYADILAAEERSCAYWLDRLSNLRGARVVCTNPEHTHVSG